MIIVYRKDSGEVLHYADFGKEIRPTLFGLYCAGIRTNHPELQYEDIAELIVDDDLKPQVFSYSKMRVTDGELVFEEAAEPSPPEPTIEGKNRLRLEELERIIENQQKLIDGLIGN